MSTAKSTKQQYEAIKQDLMKDIGVDNTMNTPRITKVVVNVGIGRIIKDSDRVQEVYDAIRDITGQLPVKTLAKKSIAGFKIREGQAVGIKVTLRGQRMWDFLTRLVGGALPRVRDFQGIAMRSVDNEGNLNIGIKEHTVFPEVIAERVRTIFSLQVTVSCDANSREDAIKMYRALGFPLHKEEAKK